MQKLNKLSDYLFMAGIILVVMSVVVGVKIFSPIVKEEVKYQFLDKGNSSDDIGNNNSEENIVPVDEEFGILIPKIGANARVIPDVDSQNSSVYQRALTKGVAHAKGTAFPGEGENIFIFAHSSADILEANKYNAVFYLLSKMEKGDDIFIYYKKQKHHYIIGDKKTVSTDETGYLGGTSKEQLTLMTCWPPGTTLKRLIVIAKPVVENNFSN